MRETACSIVLDTNEPALNCEDSGFVVVVNGISFLTRFSVESPTRTGDCAMN